LFITETERKIFQRIKNQNENEKQKLLLKRQELFCTFCEKTDTVKPIVKDEKTKIKIRSRKIKVITKLMNLVFKIRITTTTMRMIYH
jgi:hypothetical protein